MKAGWEDYYTSWSAGLLVVAQILYLLWSRNYFIRTLFDSACINSLMVGLVGPYIACVIPSFEEEHACRKKRMILNALMHATLAAYAALVLILRPIKSRALDIGIFVLLFSLIYMGWPSCSGRKWMDKVRWAYGVSCPHGWIMGAVAGFVLYCAACGFRSADASARVSPNCKGAFARPTHCKSTHRNGGRRGPAPMA